MNEIFASNEELQDGIFYCLSDNKIFYPLMICIVAFISVLSNAILPLITRTSFKTKITTRNIKYEKQSKYKGRHRWINLKKIERVCNRVVRKLLALVFHSSLCLVWHDIMLGRHIYLTRNCVFVIHKQFLKFHGERGRVLGHSLSKDVFERSTST